jgi:hypothetical protein
MLAHPLPAFELGHRRTAPSTLAALQGEENGGAVSVPVLAGAERIANRPRRRGAEEPREPRLSIEERLASQILAIPFRRAMFPS